MVEYIAESCTNLWLTSGTRRHQARWSFISDHPVVFMIGALSTHEFKEHDGKVVLVLSTSCDPSEFAQFRYDRFPLV